MRHEICPYTLQQNEVVERLYRTIIEKVRSMLSETDLEESLWAEASSIVVYMFNMTPLDFQIPEKLYSGRKPVSSHMT